jgi:hypothetical protein
MGAEYLKNINLRIMTYLRELENSLAPRITSPFDILVRNLYDAETQFHPLQSIKLKHQNREYYYSGIAKRSFNFGYKVASKFRLSEANAAMENGLLRISIPYSPHVVTKPQSITIK